uniref:30S ribosomal protein S17 n=1 Tax=Heterorhabditis bacteriophora TaxID=37862 RepID=A0A1I7WNL4_HETBA
MKKVPSLCHGRLIERIIISKKEVRRITKETYHGLRSYIDDNMSGSTVDYRSSDIEPHAKHPEEIR